MFRALFTLFRLIGEKNEESSARFTVDMQNFRYSIMDTWDGIEEQVEYWLKSYNRSGDLYECPVFWKGNPNNCKRINMLTVKANKALLISDLSTEEFVKEHFLKQYEMRGAALFHYSRDWYSNLKLYDDFGNVTEYTATRTTTEHNGEKYHLAIEISRGYNDVIAVIPVEKIEAKHPEIS